MGDYYYLHPKLYSIVLLSCNRLPVTEGFRVRLMVLHCGGWLLRGVWGFTVRERELQRGGLQVEDQIQLANLNPTFNFCI